MSGIVERMKAAIFRYPDKELTYYLQRTKEGPYNSRKYMSRKSLTGAINYIITHDSYYHLYILVAFHRQLLPMIDVDDEESMTINSLWLEENKIKYAVIQSSPRHYWIILDKPGSSWGEISKWIAMVPRSDSKCNALCQHHKRCFIRGYKAPTTGYTPRTIRHSGSAIVDGFVQLVDKHFTSPEITWLYRWQLYRTKGVAMLNNPDIDIPPVTYDAIMAELS